MVGLYLVVKCSNNDVTYGLRVTIQIMKMFKDNLFLFIMLYIPSFPLLYLLFNLSYSMTQYMILSFGKCWQMINWIF